MHQKNPIILNVLMLFKNKKNRKENLTELKGKNRYIYNYI